jgi:HNH endonuclease
VRLWNRTPDEKAKRLAQRNARETAKREKAAAAMEDRVRTILKKGTPTPFDERYLRTFLSIRGEEELERLRSEAAGLSAGMSTLELLRVLAITADEFALAKRGYADSGELAQLASGTREFDRYLRRMEEAGDALSSTHRRLLTQLGELEMRTLADDSGSEAAAEAVRAELGDGNFSVVLTALQDDDEAWDVESFLRAVAVGKAGVPPTRVDELVVRIRHVGAENLVVDVPLSVAVGFKELLGVGGILAAVREGRRSSQPGNRKPIPEAVRHEVWRRDGGVCVDCGSKERLEYDHILPLAKGGSNTARNLELRCESCNRRKGASI